MEFEKSMAVTIKGIQNVSREVSSAAEQVAASSNDLADGAANQAAVVEKLTATVAGVSEQVEQNSESAKKIMRDPLLLGKKSEDATEKDKQVGTAAKMIGVKKIIIVVAAGPFQFAMINPVITRKSGAFETEEGCLSLDGVRSCTRYEEIEVDHCNGIVI
jgi:peptide deformylase